MNQAVRFLTALLTTLTMTSIAQAAPVTVDGAAVRHTGANDDQWGVGATVSVNERPFLGVDDQQESLPYFSGQYGRFSIEGLDMSLALLGETTQRLNLVAVPRFYEVKAGFADRGELDGLSTTSDTWFAGLGYQLNLAPLYVGAQALYDVGNESDGTEVTLTVSAPFGKESWIAIPAVGLTWQDENLVEHFYGVTADEVRAGRPAYGDEASLNQHLSLTGVWRPHRHWRVLAAIKAERLGDGISDSPVIEEDSISSVLFGLVYQF